jgi:hypothetical protein
MHEMDRHRTLADCRRNSLDAAGACVTDRKYSGHTRLEQKWETAQRPLQIVGFCCEV